jgi:hypothetical protein
VSAVSALMILIALGALPVVLDVVLRVLRRRVRRRRWLGIAEAHLDEPLRAVKRARLRISPDGRSATLSGLTLGGRYAAEDDARCPRGCTIPADGCDCGFYALRPDREAEVFGASEHLLRATSVRLDVELSGAVLEYDRGYRAQHQRVLRVEVPRICASCARFHDRQEAVTLIAVPASFLPFGGPAIARAPSAHREFWPVLEPACQLHRRTRSEVPGIGLADLAGLLGTEVVWAPQEASETWPAER